MGQSGFGHVSFLAWIGPIIPPTTKPYTAIINDLACYFYLPCSVEPLFLHFSQKCKKHIHKFL